MGADGAEIRKVWEQEQWLGLALGPLDLGSLKTGCWAPPLEIRIQQVLDGDRKFTFLFVCLFLGLHLQHMEIPRLGVESELQLLGYTIATAMWDLSCICDLYRSSQQHRIPNPLHKARVQPCILMDPGWVCYH